MARSCGNSVEFDEMGYIVHAGQRLEILDVEKELAVSPRYMVNGKLRGFIPLADLSARPAFPTIDAPPWTGSPSAGNFQVSLRNHKVALAGRNIEGTLHPVSPLQLKVDDHVIALSECFENKHGTYYEDIHSCVSERDCVELDYVCDRDFCDEIVLGFSPSGELTAITDRFGTFEIRGCERYSE
ncbi:MAG: hypothetical protein R3E66_00795 [bacterium]